MRVVLRISTLILVFGCGACANEQTTIATGADDSFSIALPDGYDAGTMDIDSPEDDTEEPMDVPVAPEDDVVTPDDDTSVPDTWEPADTGPIDPQDTSTNPQVPAPTIVPTTAGCSDPGGNLNIYDLQNPECPDHPSPEPTSAPGFDVSLKDVIVTAIFGDTFFVQEQASGPYSGIAIFAHGEPLADLELGMRLTVNGAYTEYFGNTQVYLYDWTVLGTTNVPLPYVAEYPEHLATGGAAAEWFEGVLVRVDDVETTHTQPDCPDEFGEFEVTGDLRIDDMGFYWDARLGDQFESITGPLHFTFGNHKIEPRSESDIAWLSKGGDSAVSKCVATECEVSEDETGSQLLVITEVMVNPYGDDQAGEWIELYNPGNNTVSIDGWQLRDCNDQEWTVTGANTTIPPKGFLLLGPNADTATNGNITIGASYGDAYYLPNTVGSILLFDGPGFQGSLVDQIRYSAFDPWDVLSSGKSLERITPTANGTIPESWVQGSDTYGPTENQGSPGQANPTW